MPRSPVHRYPSLDRPCIHCGRPLPFTKRTQVAYCSNRCRQAAYRARHGAKPRADSKAKL